MAFQTHISALSIDEKIDYYIAQNNEDYHEQGPSALFELYEFVLDGIAAGKIDDPSGACAHVRLRVKEYRESDHW